MRIRKDRIQKDLEAINAFAATPGKGVTRFTFSKEYQDALFYVVEELRRIGVNCSFVLGGNLQARLAGSEAPGPGVMMGSHLDSVAHGGCYDGAAGVAAALEAARVIQEERFPHRLPIDVVVFAEEEGGRFGWGLLGSSTWSGRIKASQLAQIRDREGVSYPEAMEAAGIKVQDGSPLDPRSVKAMLELHIEQGGILETRNSRIGVVEAIAGIKQMIVTIEGSAGHAGTTPMDLRRDAMQGAARIIAAVETVARQEGEGGVATVGQIFCEPGQANVIPGVVRFSVDVRHSDESRLKAMAAAVTYLAENQAKGRNLRCHIEVKAEAEPVRMSPEICDLIEKVAREKGSDPVRMASGAGHDTGIMAKITDAGMIFVPSQGGRSHCAEEFTKVEDIALGAEVMLETALELAK
jgi:hydantoinase/carbamoylase family amidase